MIEVESVAFRAEVDADQGEDDDTGDGAEDEEAAAEQEEGRP